MSTPNGTSIVTYSSSNNNFTYNRPGQQVLLGPNVALLRLAGLYLPAGRGARAGCLLLHALGTAFIVLQYVELYFISDDLHLVVLTLKINMVSTNVVMKAFCYVVFQRRWRELLRYVAAADEAERARPAAAAAVRRYTALSRRVTAAFCTLSALTGVTVVLGPYIKWLSERYLDGTPHPAVDLIYQAYVPWDKTTPRGRLLANIWFALGTLYGCTVFTAFDVAAVVLMLFLGCKLQLLVQGAGYQGSSRRRSRQQATLTRVAAAADSPSSSPFV